MTKHFYILLLIIFCGCISASEKNDLNSTLENDKTQETIQTDYRKMLIGAWEMDSMKLENGMYTNTKWVEVFNDDSTHCFFQDIEHSHKCIYAKSGTTLMYKVQNGKILQYRKYWSTNSFGEIEKIKEIIRLDEDLFIYKTNIDNTERIYYYHRIND